MQTATRIPARDSLSVLVEQCYADLVRVAARLLRREYRARDLEPQELAHELYLRLAASSSAPPSTAAELLATARFRMRQILVDGGRRRTALKRHPRGEQIPVEMVPARSVPARSAGSVLHLLQGLGGRKCRVVRLRYLDGMQNQEIAHALAVSLGTVERDLRVARLWLRQSLASVPAIA